MLSKLRKAGSRLGQGLLAGLRRGSLTDLALWCLCAWLLVLGYVLFGATGHDDPHITYWSAYAFAEFGEIVNHSGAAVEQSSSLTQTLMLALAYKLSGVPVPLLGHIFSVAAALLAIVRLPALVAEDEAPRAVVIGTILVASPLYVYWSVGGLETSLFGWLAIELLIALRIFVRLESVRRVARIWIRLIFVSAAFAACRPEAPLMLVCMLGAGLLVALIDDRPRARRVAVALIIAVAIGVALTSWRVWRFGVPLPEPVAAKLGHGVNDTRLTAGLQYLMGWFGRAEAFPWAVGMGLGIACIFRPHAQRRLEHSFAVFLAGAGTCFVVLVGGDWMSGYRFTTQLVPLFAAVAVQQLPLERLSRGARAGFMLACLVVGLGGTVLHSARSPRGMQMWWRESAAAAMKPYTGDIEYTFPELYNVSHARDTIFIDDLDRVVSEVIAHQGHAKIFSLQAGMVMFHISKRHYGDIEFYDRAGLVDRHYSVVAEKYALPSNTLGLNWTQEAFFKVGAHEPEAVRKALFEPDIIFDLYTEAFRSVQRHDYVIVHQQQGKIRIAPAAHTRCWSDPPPKQPEMPKTPAEVDAEKANPPTAIERVRAREEAKRAETEFFGFDLSAWIGRGPRGVDRLVREITRRAARDKRSFVDDRFWRSQYGVYQWIALRRDLAIELGYVEAPAPKRGQRRQGPQPGPDGRVELKEKVTFDLNPVMTAARGIHDDIVDCDRRPPSEDDAVDEETESEESEESTTEEDPVDDDLDDDADR